MIIDHNIWIDIAIATGDNRVDTASFRLSNKNLEQIKNNLLIDAIINAKSKADIGAFVLGSKVTDLIVTNCEILSIVGD